MQEKERKRIYRIFFSYENGYIIKWSWENDDEWYWYDTACTLWGAKRKIRKAEKVFAKPSIIGTFNDKGKRID